MTQAQIFDPWKCMIHGEKEIGFELRLVVAFYPASLLGLAGTKRIDGNRSLFAFKIRGIAFK